MINICVMHAPTSYNIGWAGSLLRHYSTCTVVGSFCSTPSSSLSLMRSVIADGHFWFKLIYKLLKVH